MLEAVNNSLLFFFFFFLKESSVPMISILKLRKLFSFCYCSLSHVQFLFNATPIVCAYIFSFSQAKENTYEVISTVIRKTHTHFLFFENKIQAYTENAESHCSRFLTLVLFEFWNTIFTFIFFLYRNSRKHLSIVFLSYPKQTNRIPSVHT